MKRVPPYIWLSVLYLGFIAAWVGLILFAIRHTPPTVPLEEPKVSQSHER